MRGKQIADSAARGKEAPLGLRAFIVPAIQMELVH